MLKRLLLVGTAFAGACGTPAAAQTAKSSYSIQSVLSGGILGGSSRTLFSSSTLQVLGWSGAAARQLAVQEDGSWFAATSTFRSSAFAANGIDLGARAGLAHAPSDSWSAAYSRAGMYVGFGEGNDAALLFSDARWGARTAFFNTGIDAGGLLLALTPGATYSAIGFDFGNKSRLALGVATTPERPVWLGSAADASARAIGISYTFQPAAGVSVSFTNSYLDERKRLLGSTSAGPSPLNGSAMSAAVGAGFNVALGGGFQFGFDAAIARTGATHETNGLFLNTSPLTSTAMSIALSKENLTDANDSLGVFIQQPMRVMLGNADISVPNGNSDPGDKLMKTLRKSIVPTGKETNIGFGYSRPLADGIDGKINLNYRTNADNIAGATDAAAMFHLRAKF